MRVSQIHLGKSNVQLAHDFLSVFLAGFEKRVTEPALPGSRAGAEHSQSSTIPHQLTK
jgi:hypothetical protein